MKFRMSYYGELKSRNQKSRTNSNKWELRKVFHDQLCELWNVHPVLESYRNDDSFLVEKNGRTFRALTTKKLHLVCSLNILFLRSGNLGRAISNGDIDNKIKTLIDSLRIPQQKNEMEGIENGFGADEVINCLMEDDDLVVDFSVETDLLLRKPAKKENFNPIEIILLIEVRRTRDTWKSSGFF